MSGPKAEPDDNESLTVAGCILTALSFLVILASAVPIVLWRSPAGQPLPRVVAIVSPLLIGAAFHSIVNAQLDWCEPTYKLLEHGNPTNSDATILAP